MIFYKRTLLSGAGIKAFLLILFTIPIINLIAILMSLKKPKPQFLSPEEGKALVKRKNLRISYLNTTKPVVQIKRHYFDVMDLSEGGLRFNNSAGIVLSGRIKGKTTLHCGEQITFKGKVYREENNETTILLKKPIPYATIYTEKEYLKTM